MTSGTIGMSENQPCKRAYDVTCRLPRLTIARRSTAPGGRAICNLDTVPQSTPHPFIPQATCVEDDQSKEGRFRVTVPQ